ncbi:methionyl-tRNA formyltransferase [Candidatus Kaiserbacteria bacterium]|nr:methionyl-tRNA formyltransferase [Candidatus Kaiserbacteria bacterium]
MNKTSLKFVFFGGEPLGVPVLEELKAASLTPELIICNPDRPVGRKQKLTPPPVKLWAEQNNIETFQPTSYKDEGELTRLNQEKWDLFVVVAYNFILPKWCLELPKHGVLNVHPSLLPKLRGASPIRTAIKDGLREDIGVTIMQMDEEMDHGPILDQIYVPIADDNWPVSGPELDLALAHTGGTLLADVIPEWLAGNIDPQEQDHDTATYCGRLTKEDSRLDLNPLNLPSGSEALVLLQKIKAFEGIGDTFFIHNGKRVKIKSALIENEKLSLKTVIPEGKNEITFSDYLKNTA